MVRIGLLVHWSISLLVYLLVSTNMFTVRDACATNRLPRAVLLPSASAAVSDDAMATAFNPAGLGVKRGVNGYYLHTFSGETGGDNAFFISLSGFGFGAEFADPGWGGFSKYTLSDGMRLYNGLYLGSSYAWFNSENDAYDRLSSWDIGLLWRPSRLLSLGLVARNLNRSVFDTGQAQRPAPTSRMYDLSFALRPYTNRLTLSVDSELQEEQEETRHAVSLRDARITYAVEYEPIDGITLRGSYSRDRGRKRENNGNFDIRVGISFPQFEVGAYSRFDSDRKRDGGVAYARFSSERYRTKFRTGGYILEVGAEDLARGRIQDSPLLRAKEDETVDGMILRLGTAGASPSFGIVQEMRDVILDFRASGKKTICYMELGGDKEYYLAAACDEIALNHAGHVHLDGLRSEATFYKGVLDKLGIEADLYHIGKYKSSSEIVTREDMSDAHRESLNSLLDDLYNQMVSGIAEGRGISRVEVMKRIDEGPYTAREAMSAGLVDELIYADQVEEVVKKKFGRKVKRLTGEQYGRCKYHRYDWDTRPKLAVIYATGMIAPGKSLFTEEGEHIGSPLPIPRIMGSETITNAIRKAREDSSIEAIVLRIDSPGGLVFASDLIWREVVLAKDKKPLIVSMGGVAGSGGYYIACPAHVIVAEPGTITGSIGVISGKFSLRGFYDKLGVKKEILKRGKNSDIYTDYGGFTDEQREIINRQMREIYDDFVCKVAQGRNMTEETVEPIAQGRVWTGRQAKENGLVDELGGLQLAVSIAKAKAGLEPGESLDILALPKRIPLWRRLIFGETPLLHFIRGQVLSETSVLITSLADVIEAAEGLANEKIFLLMPYTVDYE